MLNLKRVLLFSCVWLLLVAMVVTPQPVTPNIATITWVTQSETTYLNVWIIEPDTLVWVGNVTGGVTTTLTLASFEGAMYQVHEFKLVGCCLERVTFFSTAPAPHVDFPTVTATPTQTTPLQPTNTPVATPTLPSVTLTPRVYTPIVKH